MKKLLPFGLLVALSLAVAGCAKQTPVDATDDPPPTDSTKILPPVDSTKIPPSSKLPFTHASIRLDSIAVIDTNPVLTRLTSTSEAMDCVTNTCTSDATSWYASSGQSSDDGYTSSSSSRKLSVVIDSVRKEIVSLDWAYSVHSSGGFMTSQHGNYDFDDRRIHLAHLPYTQLPDGSISCDISGSAIANNILEVSWKSSGYQNVDDRSRPWNHASTNAPVQPEVARIRITLN